MSRQPRVSDHAILRYIERVKGFNVDALRREIAGACVAALAIGATKVSVKGVTYVLDPAANAVITIMDGGTPAGSRYRGNVVNGRRVQKFQGDERI